MRNCAPTLPKPNINPYLLSLDCYWAKKISLKNDDWFTPESTKLTFGLSDVLAITVFAQNRINSVDLLFFRDRILRFGKNMP